MGKDNTKASAAKTLDANLENEVVVETIFVEETTEEVNEVEVIASDVFISEDGTELTFGVSKFIYKGKSYKVADAVKDHTDVLEELANLNSSIFKR